MKEEGRGEEEAGAARPRAGGGWEVNRSGRG